MIQTRTCSVPDVSVAVVGTTRALRIQEDGVCASLLVRAVHNRVLEPVHEDCLVRDSLLLAASRKTPSVCPASKRRGINEGILPIPRCLVIGDKRIGYQGDLVQGDQVSVCSVQDGAKRRRRVGNIGDQGAGALPQSSQIDLRPLRTQESFELFNEGVEHGVSRPVRGRSSEEARAPGIHREQDRGRELVELEHKLGFVRT